MGAYERPRLALWYFYYHSGICESFVMSTVCAPADPVRRRGAAVRCDGAMWRIGVAMWCGGAVWQCGVAVRCGGAVWRCGSTRPVPNVGKICCLKGVLDAIPK